MEEQVFGWSLDGFGSKLFRITSNGRENFVNRYSSMDVEENNHEVSNIGEILYISFEEFWIEFTQQPLWLRYSPVFIHKDYKPFLRDFLNNIDQGSLTMGDLFRISLWLFITD